LPALLLVAVTCLAYANAWPNTLIFDDKPFLDYQSFTDFSAIPRYFTENVWATRGLRSDLYRPLLSVSVTLDARLFGDWFAGWHLVNILLHAAVTVLLYAFLARLLAMDERTRASSAFAALLAALVFAVHPMNTEVVNSVFNRSNTLAALGMLGGLWWLLRYLESRPLLAWTGLFLAYLYALFCREIAIVLPGMAAILVLVYADGGLSIRIRKTLPVFTLLIPMAFYLHMRDSALVGATPDPDSIETAISAVAGQLDARRLLQGEMILKVAGMWAQAFGVILWPFEPMVHYSSAPRVLRWAAIFIHLGLLGLAVFQFTRGRKGLLAGLVIFYLGLLPSSRLFGGGDVLPHLSLRYLYGAAAGFMVLVAYALSYLQHRFDRLLAAAPVLLLLLVLMPTTWARNASWADEITLFETDYRRGARSGHLLRLLTGAYLKKSDFPKVIEICDANRNKQVPDSNGMFTLHCASALSYSGRHEEAERAYLVAAMSKTSRRLAYSNLAQHYLRQGRRDDARVQFEKAVEAESDPALKAYQAGIMLTHVYTGNPEKWRQARDHFEEALRLQPGMSAAQDWLHRIDRALGEEPAGEQ
jgi:tetratricopeptide (TPR) repeat protein